MPDTETMARRVTKAQRERWFTEGAAALRRTLSGMGMADSLPDSEFYACPLCLVAYGRDAFEAGVFTVEHVPPHSAGGDPLLLTCERCNSTAGAAMDAHAAGRKAVDDLFAGRSLRRALRAEFDVGGVTVYGNVNSENGAFLMNVVPKANNPKDITAITETLKNRAAAGTGGSIGFKFREHVSPELARLSAVRAGYLAAFAALGWRYAFLECLQPLREQLAEPETAILPSLVFIDPAAEPGRRRLLVTEEPAEMRTLAVMLGRFTVFLPRWDEPKSMEEISAGLAWYDALPASRKRCTRTQIPWPAYPQYKLDP